MTSGFHALVVKWPLSAMACVFLAVCLASGCGGSRASRDIVVLVDRTRSFFSFDESLGLVRRLVIHELEPGDRITVMFIYNKLNDVPVYVIKPTLLPLQKGRLAGDEASEIRKIKTDMLSELESASKVDRTKEGTELMQSLAFAKNLLADGASREKWLIVCSDLEDTIGSSVKLDFSGIRIRTHFLPTRGQMKKLEEMRGLWTEGFKDKGAESVKVFDSGQSLIIERVLK